MNYKDAEIKIKDLVNGSNEVLKDVVDFLENNFTHYSWVGIYLVEGSNLILGPWKGPYATEHTCIPIGQGICGAAAASGTTEVIPDVNSDNRYLSCFVSTKSEIVIPIKKNGKIVGEIDIDSDKTAAFSREDCDFLNLVADLISPFI